MLIRNVRSFRDLENQKKMQAELLQLQIDNEALLEKRVGDYQNPNKPPPVPPQYKTQSEVDLDNLAQQKMAIDNLRLLGADYAVAAQVSQELLQLPDGEGALVKLNKFFPQIQKFFDDTISSKSRNSSLVLMEKLKEYFSRIDTAVGINIRDTNATNMFGRDSLIGANELPTKEIYEDLLNSLDGLFKYYDFNKELVIDPIMKKTYELYDYSPTKENIDSINTLPIIERQNYLKDIEELFKIYKIPENKFLVPIISNLINALDETDKTSINQKPTDEIKTYLASYTNILKNINDSSIKNLQKLNNSFAEKIINISNEAQQNIGQPLEDEAIRRAINKAGDKLNKDNIDQTTLQDYTDQAYNYAISNPSIKQKSKELKGAKMITRLITAENERIQKEIETKQLLDTAATKIGTIGRRALPRKKVVELKKERKINLKDAITEAKNLYNINKRADAEYNNKKLEMGEIEDARDNLNPFLPKDLQFTTGGNYKKSNIYTAIIYLRQKRDELTQQGFGLTDRVLKHFKEDNNDLLKLKKGFNRHLQVEKIADGYSSSDSSMEGKGVKKAFKAHRIKLGKGISIPEIPKYREFGKFIVHYPQLIDSNILNLKFPSTGTIPHIKPVYVDENFKEFIIDTLNTGRVNNRHFDSLTEPEKSHFTKIARGAKLTEKLNLKPLTEDREKEDLNRLQLMLGEINAGNDNEKLLKEARALVKKYIANGRINKNKGLEILLELE